MTTYYKLRNGTWGLRGDRLTAGAIVTVTTKAGATKTETVGHILWSGNGISLATISGRGNTTRPSRTRRGCGCDCEDCRNGCRCDAHCNCRGGNIYDC